MFQKWESNPYGDYRGVVAKSEIDNSPRITVGIESSFESTVTWLYKKGEIT